MIDSGNGLVYHIPMEAKTSLFVPSPLERSSLKEQAAELLRDLIVSGRIAAGSKITERDVAEKLKVSRMPARDALMDLERQGLVETKPDGRYVVALGAEDVAHLYRVRLNLEKLALELALPKMNESIFNELRGHLLLMRAAIDGGDKAAYVASDLATHQTLWRTAGNPYLTKTLESMIGPIFIFISSQVQIHEDWELTYKLHEDLLRAVYQRNLVEALHQIDIHMESSLELTMEVLANKESR